MSRFNHVRALAVLLSMGWLTAGCASSDEYVFLSTPHVPKSVALIDTIEDRTLWSLDIPVGHELEIDLDRPFDTKGIHAPNVPARRMTWKLYEYGRQAPRPGTGERLPVEQGLVNLSGNPVMITMSLREPSAPTAPSAAEPRRPAQTQPEVEALPVPEPMDASPAEEPTVNGGASESMEPAEPAQPAQPGAIMRFDVQPTPTEPATAGEAAQPTEEPVK